MEMRVCKDKRGVAGLEVLLSVVTILFLIGFIITIFAISGSEIQETTLVGVSGTIANQTCQLNFSSNPTLLNVTNFGYDDLVCTIADGYVLNASSSTPIGATNYSVNGTSCKLYLTGAVGTVWNESLVNVTYTYTGKANTTATDTIYNTYISLSDTVDWFSIIIIITAMVVLILLTVIIISAIRGSGMAGGLGGPAREPTTSA